MQMESIPTEIPSDVVTGPIALGEGVEIDYYYMHDESDSGNLRHLFGMMTNRSDVALTAPSLRFTLFDAEGNVLDTIGGTPLYEWLAPGASMPFTGYMSEDRFATLGDWDSETVETCFGVFPADPKDNPANLELRSVEETEREDNKIQITGQVFNRDDADASPVKVTALFFDRDGRYVGDLADYLSVDVPAQRSARFTIDQGYSLFHSFNPLDLAEDNEATYVLTVGIGGNVTIGCS